MCELSVHPLHTAQTVIVQGHWVCTLALRNVLSLTCKIPACWWIQMHHFMLGLETSVPCLDCLSVCRFICLSLKKTILWICWLQVTGCCIVETNQLNMCTQNEQICSAWSRHLLLRVEISTWRNISSGHYVCLKASLQCHQWLLRSRWLTNWKM